MRVEERCKKVMTAVMEYYGEEATDPELNAFLSLPENRAALESLISDLDGQIRKWRKSAKTRDPFNPPAQPDGSDAECAGETGEPAADSAKTATDPAGTTGEIVAPAASPHSPHSPQTAVEPMKWENPGLDTNKPDAGFRLPNARVGIEYNHPIEQIGKETVSIADIQGLRDVGLMWDEQVQKVTGTPTQAGTFTLAILFTRIGQSNRWREDMDLVSISDPKALWKDNPSNPSEPFHKPDSARGAIDSDDCLMVGASRRGRSHAHEGSCRDDDFQLTDITAAGWRILSVSDGAGSADFSREGSRIAVQTCSTLLTHELARLDDELVGALQAWSTDKSEANGERAKRAVYSVFRIPVYRVVEEIHKLAKASEIPFKKFYATLLIGAHKVVDGKHYVVGYWRGDGGMALLSDDNYVHLMGAPDGGEYAGQTRFMDSEAASQDDILSRVRFDVVEEMTALMLLTDGITDPLFPSDADLEEPLSWSRYWHNQVAPCLGEDAEASAQNLLESLDFWSKGNHDDRTVALLCPKAAFLPAEKAATPEVTESQEGEVAPDNTAVPEETEDEEPSDARKDAEDPEVAKTLEAEVAPSDTADAGGPSAGQPPDAPSSASATGETSTEEEPDG